VPENQSIFDELFVLELANNHWGNVERGLKIIRDFGKQGRTAKAIRTILNAAASRTNRKVVLEILEEG